MRGKLTADPPKDGSATIFKAETRRTLSSDSFFNQKHFSILLCLTIFAASARFSGLSTRLYCYRVILRSGATKNLLSLPG